MKKLLGGKFVELLPVSVPTVAEGVANLAVPAVQQTVIADRHAMRIATQVINQFPWTGEGGFRVDHPR